MEGSVRSSRQVAGAEGGFGCGRLRSTYGFDGDSKVVVSATCCEGGKLLAEEVDVAVGVGLYAGGNQNRVVLGPEAGMPPVVGREGDQLEGTVEVFQVGDGEVAAFTGEESYVGEYACQIDAAVERLGGGLVCSSETGAKATRFFEGKLEGVHLGGLGEY